MLALLVFHRLSLIGIISKVADGALIKVTQYPKRQAVSRSTDVKLYCAFSLPDPNSYVKVHWWKQGESRYLQRMPDKRTTFGFDSKSCGLFQLNDTTLQDSGVYYCSLIIDQKIVGNGTGSQLTVYVPPDPLKIEHTAPQKNSPTSLSLVCKTAAFYPENLTLTWHKNGTEIPTGIITTKQQNTDGLYEVSSSLEEIQPVVSGLVYTCRVSHLNNQTAEIAYTVPPRDTQREGSRLQKIQIAGVVVGGLAFLVLLVIIIGKMKGLCRKHNLSDHHGKQGVQGSDAEKVAYATLELKSSKKHSRPKHQEERTVYAQTKQGVTPNKLTYATLEFPGSKKTGKCKRIEKDTQYAEIQINQGAAGNK